MNKYKLRSICKKISDETGLSYNVIQTHYFLETILEKISKSDENQNFFLRVDFCLRVLLELSNVVQLILTS